MSENGILCFKPWLARMGKRAALPESIMNSRKVPLSALLLGAGLLLLVALPAAAQGGALRLSLARTWGYSLGSDIQGSFVMTASGPQDLRSVKFFVDDQSLGEATQAPFRVGLQTGQFAAGKHILHAIGETGGGQTLRSNDLTVNMLSGAQSGKATGRLAVPLVIGILLVTALAAGGSAWLAGRSSRGVAPGEARNYGLGGGVICPKCGRPFALPVLAPNVVTGKLVHCPYCGKWSVARRASREALAAAEAAEVIGSRPTVPEMSEEEKLRRQIEESRYR